MMPRKKTLGALTLLTLGMACNSAGRSDQDTLPGDGASGENQVSCTQDQDCAQMVVSLCQKATCDLGTRTCIVVADPDLEGIRCEVQNNLCAIGNGRCREGFCVPTQVRDCEDQDPCTNDSCDPATGACRHEPLDQTPCDDGDPCTENDRCRQGICKAGTPVCQCAQDSDCTQPENRCLGRYQCDLTTHTCRIQPETAVTCPPSEEACQESFCDPTDGQCKTRALRDGVPCSDGDPCTLDDSCLNGACTGQARDCDDHNSCTDDRCNAATGDCFHEDLSDVPCDDQDLCTVGETCLQGHCGGGQAVFGCCHQNAECDDGSACSRGACQDHQCVFWAVGCPSSEDPCVPNLCRDDGTCEQTSRIRRDIIWEVRFDGRLPPGTRLDPPEDEGAWILDNDGLSRKPGSTTGRVYLPPVPTGPDLHVLAAYHPKDGAGIRAWRGNKVFPWNWKQEAMAFVVLPENSQESLSLEVPPGAHLLRVQALRFPRASCRPTPIPLSQGPVLDYALIPSDRGELLLVTRVPYGNQYQVALRSFNEAGRPMGPEVRVPEPYSATNRFRITGLWTGDRFRVAYGGVQIGNNQRIRQVEYREGTLLGISDFSDLPDQQSEPVLAWRGDQRVACYTSSTVDSQQLGIVCRIGEAPWSAVNSETSAQDQFRPHIAIQSDNRVLVVWNDGITEIRGRMLGEPPDNSVHILASGILSDVQVAVSDRTVLVVFQEFLLPLPAKVRVQGRLIQDGIVQNVVIQPLSGSLEDIRSPQVVGVDDGFLLVLSRPFFDNLLVVQLDTAGNQRAQQILAPSAGAQVPLRMAALGNNLFGIAFPVETQHLLFELFSNACQGGWYGTDRICIGPTYY